MHLLYGKSTLCPYIIVESKGGCFLGNRFKLPIDRTPSVENVGQKRYPEHSIRSPTRFQKENTMGLGESVREH